MRELLAAGSSFDYDFFCTMSIFKRVNLLSDLLDHAEVTERRKRMRT